jgi:hypothetical protein
MNFAFLPFTLRDAFQFNNRNFPTFGVALPKPFCLVILLASPRLNPMPIETMTQTATSRADVPHTFAFTD